MRNTRLATAYAPTTMLAAALLAAPMIVAPVHPAAAQLGIALSITVAPPPLPVYEQPPLPAPGYIFTPGYWAYGPVGYYWVPATWVEPPAVGLLWTPGYWGWNNGFYVFNRGYWGPHVGFYGGINYGFGYGGFGYEGGFWRGGVFSYNAAVNRFGGVHVTNVYTRNVTNVTVRNVSFNGPGGIAVRPTPQEEAFAHETHVQPTPLQEQHVQAAAQNHALLASVNHGRPAIAAVARPGDFHTGIVPARATLPVHPVAHAPYTPGMVHGVAPRPGFAPHPMMAPRPMVAPHPMAAPRPMAPHAAPRPHEEHPGRP